MNRKSALMILAALFFVFVFGSVFFLFFQKSARNTQQVINPPSTENLVFVSSTTAATPVPSVVVLSPIDVARNFYSWYISYPGNPLTTGAYKTSDYLSDSYKKTISDLLSTSTDPQYDPVFCPKNKLVHFAVSPVTYDDSGKKADIFILKYNGEGDSIYKISMQNTDSRWLITNIICLP